MKWLVIFAFLLVACEDSPEEKKAKAKTEQEKITMQIDSHTKSLSEDLEYYKDTRTGLCFSGMYIGYYATAITNVPCTPEVEKVAHSFKSVR